MTKNNAKSIPANLEGLGKRVTKGEGKFFASIKNTLDSNCLIYYEMIVGERDRRPDFVIIDRDFGFTIIEVKDWSLDRIVKAEKETVTYLSLSDNKVKVMNPQLKCEFYLKEIKEQLLSEKILRKENKLILNVRYFICFPNINRNEFLALKEKWADPNRIIFGDELGYDKLKKIYNTNLKKISIGINYIQFNKIRTCLFPDLLIKIPILDENKVIGTDFELDLDQEEIAKSLSEGPRLLRGYVGTGKTLIILYRAKLSLSISEHYKKPKKILILCWNISLSTYIKNALNNINIKTENKIEIYHFSEFVRILLKAKNLKLNVYNDDFDFYLEKAIGLLKENIDLNHKYDEIYLDEAQDFDKNWIKFIWENLFISNEAKTKNLLIAGDDSQNIYKRNISLKDSAFDSGFFKEIGIPMQGRSKVLRKIYRNSARVWFFSLLFLDTEFESFAKKELDIKFAPKRGFDPKLYECNSLDEQIDVIVTSINQLKEYNFAYKNFMVLYSRKSYNGYNIVENLIRKLNINQIPNQWITENDSAKKYFDWNENSVIISTIHSAKGLDCPVVFLLSPDLLYYDKEKYSELKKLVYVGMTRAREVLYITFNKTDSLLTKELKETIDKFKKSYNFIIKHEDKSKESPFSIIDFNKFSYE